MRLFCRPITAVLLTFSLTFLFVVGDDRPSRAAEKEVAESAAGAQNADADDPLAAGAEEPTDGDAPNADDNAPKVPDVPFDATKGVTFGPVGCFVAVLGTNVWDLKTEKPISQLAGTYDHHGLRCISDDGRFFAAGSKSPNQTDTAVTVWNTETGQRVLEVPGDKDAFVDFLGISRGKYLLLGGRHNDQIDVWEIETGKIIKHLKVPAVRISPNKLALSPDGKQFAYIAHDKLIVTSTVTNRQVAVMAPPSKEPGSAAAPAKKPPRPKRAVNTDASSIYAWTRGMAFSPDGTELAAYSTHPLPRILVWNIKGKLVFDEPLQMPLTIGHDETFEWRPDGSGWLIKNRLYDRKAKRVVLSVRVPFAAQIPPHLIDAGYLIGAFGNDRERLRAIPIPHERLNESIQQMVDQAPSYLKPGDAVSLRLELAGLRGDETETRKVLTEALTRRLARENIRVAENQATVLYFKLSEKAGESLPVYHRQSPFDIWGTDTGRRVTEAKGSAVVELWTDGENEPLWRGYVEAMSTRSIQEAMNDNSVRKNMLDRLVRLLSGLDMPYFIPKAKEIVALPAVVE
ncbi:MAG TPA: hypothetical protein VHC22_30675 [Pirellulales bacterium]|nr:hypothetical protein [Pirellulales bacterium]